MGASGCLIEAVSCDHQMSALLFFRRFEIGGLILREPQDLRGSPQQGKAGMPITFVPDAGDILMCDFRGVLTPEMTKLRRVIILSPRLRRVFPNTYLVVPISMSKPVPTGPHHCRFAPGSYTAFHQTEPAWAKADMLTCVGSHRLDRVRIDGRYSRASISAEDLLRVRGAVLHALGMEAWQEVTIRSRITDAGALPPLDT
jgi:uncharacterized protein YifN (PemK superfamily)